MNLAPLDLILLPSATRTATTTTVVINNPGYQALKLFLNVSAASGTGGLYPQLNYYDPVTQAPSGQTVWGTTGKTVTGLFIYQLFPEPSLNVLSGGLAVDFLPSQFSISIHHGDATNYTYSLGAILLG